MGARLRRSRRREFVRVPRLLACRAGRRRVSPRDRRTARASAPAVRRHDRERRVGHRAIHAWRRARGRGRVVRHATQAGRRFPVRGPHGESRACSRDDGVGEEVRGEVGAGPAVGGDAPADLERTRGGGPGKTRGRGAGSVRRSRDACGPPRPRPTSPLVGSPRKGRGARRTHPHSRGVPPVRVPLRGPARARGAGGAVRATHEPTSTNHIHNGVRRQRIRATQPDRAAVPRGTRRRLAVARKLDRGHFGEH